MVLNEVKQNKGCKGLTKCSYRSTTDAFPKSAPMALRWWKSTDSVCVQAWQRARRGDGKYR